jgi:hypothetical protein
MWSWKMREMREWAARNLPLAFALTLILATGTWSVWHHHGLVTHAQKDRPADPHLDDFRDFVDARIAVEKEQQALVQKPAEQPTITWKTAGAATTTLQVGEMTALYLAKDGTMMFSPNGVFGNGIATNVKCDPMSDLSWYHCKTTPLLTYEQIEQNCVAVLNKQNVYGDKMGEDIQVTTVIQEQTLKLRCRPEATEDK